MTSPMVMYVVNTEGSLQLEKENRVPLLRRTVRHNVTG